MRLILFFSILVLTASCNSNNAGTTAKTFCDTACNNDPIVFKSEDKFHPFVSISEKNCLADTLTWTHDRMLNTRQMQIPNLLNNIIRLNKSAVSCYIKDTSYAYLAFNDCISGRGYLLKLPFNKKESINKISSALNAFDKKFVVPDDLRAYTDYSTIYVVNVKTDKKELMTFKEEFDIDFNDVHKVIDSINISHNRIFVLLKKDGKDLPLEKTISL